MNMNFTLNMHDFACWMVYQATEGHVTCIDTEVLSVTKTRIQIFMWSFDTHAY